MTYKIPKTFFGIKTDEAMERVLSKDKTKVSAQPIQAPIAPQNLEDYWRIGGVSYKNQICAVDLLKALLDSGNTKTQDEWAEYSKIAKQSNSFYTGDFPLYNSLFTALFSIRNEKTTEEIRKFLKDQFEAHWLTTLTRIKYAPNGLDEIVHNYHQQDQYTINENIIGPDGYLKNTETNAQPALNAVLGSNNTAEIDEVYNWITGKDAYLWRLNKKPEQNEERVARFSADSDRADLFCNRSPSCSYSSLGVRLAKFP